MKHARSLSIVLAALAASLFPQNVRADAEVSFEYFEEALSPFGEWIEVADYGLCWRPTGVGENWAPYTDGYWAYTDAGWTWVSYEDWGGITYHYGRWIHLVDEGWVWVPDYQWGPAWVSWRSSEEYVGWAPLPPEALWEETTGFSTWVDTSYDIGPESYRFCHTRDFGAPVLAPVCLPYEQNVTFIVSTVNVTNICYNHHSSVVFCGGPDFININRHCQRPIPSLKLRCEDREVRGPHGNRQPQIVRGNALAVYAPKMKRPVDLKALPVKPQRVVGAEKINRGWSRGSDLAGQQEIKQRLQKQTEGLTPRTAPARPVRTADLSSVPVKALPNVPSPNVVVRDHNTPPRNPARPPAVAGSTQPQRPVAVPAPATPAPERARPVQNPPPVAERVSPQPERPASDPRPVQPTPVMQNNPSPPVAARPPQPNPQPPRVPQVAVPDENARAAEVERSRVQREQQAAQRSAAVRQQQEAAQRANELRQQQAQQNQQQENARRASVERSQRVDEQRQRQQSEAAGREQEARRQQQLQQRQQAVASQQQENANRVAAVRQQQEAAQRSNELRQRQAEQQQSAQRANEMRAQQAQQAEVARQRQEASHRQNEMRQPQQQQQERRAEPPQRQQAAPAPQPQPQSRPAPTRGDDDDKHKQRSR